MGKPEPPNLGPNAAAVSVAADAGRARGAGAAVDVKGVWFGYDATPALEEVNLQIERGDFVCLVGPNGGGKTTLLRLMLGLLRPSKGTIRVLGETPERGRRNIGYMPQRTQLDPQFPVTVRDVVLMGRLGRGWQLGPFGRADRFAALRALETVQLADRARSSFAALSGGQRQRVLIARALACEPQILMLDEPSANLDPRVQDELYDLLLELNKHLTVIIVSHDVGFVSNYVRSIVCVNRQVETHASGQLSPELMRELYGHGVQQVHHHHHEHDHGHDHDHGSHRHP